MDHDYCLPALSILVRPDADQQQNSKESGNRISEQPPKKDPMEEIFSSPKIVERIVEHLDFWDQKRCRGLSKIWNEEICRVFKKTCVALCIEDERNRSNDITDKMSRSLSKFLAAVEAGKDLNPTLPSPFQDLSVVLDLKYVDSTLAKLKSLPCSVIALKFRISDLNQVTDIKTIQAKAESAIPLIQHCAPTLTHLITPSWKADVAGIELNLPKLKRLTVLFKVHHMGVEFEEVHTQGNFFLKCLAGAPKLEEFYIDVETNRSRNIALWRHPPSSCISNFLSVANLRMIQVLSVEFTDHPKGLDMLVMEDTLKFLTLIEVPQLKRLRISSSISYSNKHWTIDLVLKVVAHFKESLQEFRTDFEVFQLCKFPRCPALTNLILESELKLKYLDLSNLPSLKRIELGEVDVKGDHYFRGAPILTVETVCNETYSESDGDPEPWQVDKYYKTLFDWFPNVKTWEVRYPLLESELPSYIKKKNIENQKIVARKSRKSHLDKYF